MVAPETVLKEAKCLQRHMKGQAHGAVVSWSEHVPCMVAALTEADLLKTQEPVLCKGTGLRPTEIRSEGIDLGGTCPKCGHTMVLNFDFDRQEHVMPEHTQ